MTNFLLIVIILIMLFGPKGAVTAMAFASLMVLLIGALLLLALAGFAIFEKRK